MLARVQLHRCPRGGGLLAALLTVVGCSGVRAQSEEPGAAPVSGSVAVAERQGEVPPRSEVEAVIVHIEEADLWKFPPVSPKDQARSEAKLDKPTRPCAADSDEHAAAVKALRGVGKQIMALENYDSPADAVLRLQQVLSGPCFDLNGDATQSGKIDSGFALRTWWDQQGRRWAEHHLELSHRADDPGAEVSAHFFPTVRQTLSLETTRDHPLKRFLCSLHDQDCGAETRGWKRRANMAMAAHPERDDRYEDEVPQSCETEALAQPPELRYMAWQNCELDRIGHIERLPLGGTKAPTRGWLIVEGRRGHYSFCDQVAAFDLTTGATYVLESCSGLQFSAKSLGEVDHRAVDAGRGLVSRTGQVPVDNLREAMWMMLMLGEVETRVRSGWLGRKLPAGIDPQLPVVREINISSGSFTTDSGQTRLGWRYVVDEELVAEGRLTWPGSYEAGEDHAVQLLRVAEEGLVAGCTLAEPPSADLFHGGAGVSHLDADTESLSKTARALMEAWEGLEPSVCR